MPSASRTVVRPRPSANRRTPSQPGARIERVPFRDEDLEAVREEGRVWIPLRPLCERLGLAERPQIQRLRRVPWAFTRSIVIADRYGDVRPAFCVTGDTFAAWLATLTPGRLKAAVRTRLASYQRFAPHALSAYFFGRPATTVAPG